MLGQAAEAFPPDLLAQLVHAAEVGVDDHGRGADLPGQAAQGQAGGALLGDEPGRALDQRRAQGGVRRPRAHVDSMP